MTTSLKKKWFIYEPVAAFLLNIYIHQHKNQSIFHPSNRENEIKCILVVIDKYCQTNMSTITTSFVSIFN